MSRQTEQMWATLVEAGVTEGEAPETGTLESPWYVKALLAFSGWLASLFFLGFVGIWFEFVFDNSTAALIIGGLMIVGAFILLHNSKNEFFEHLALAVSLAGQALVVFGIFELFNHNEKTAWLLVALLQLPLGVIMPNYVHRVFSSFLTAIAFSIALSIMGWPDVFGGIVMLLAAFCWLDEFRFPKHMRITRAVGYGLVMALILIKGIALFGYRGMGLQVSPNRYEAWWDKPWIGELLMGAVALYVVWNIMQRYGHTISDRLSVAALLGTLLLCVVSMEAQGITVGLLIMLLGFGSGNRVLLGLGIVSLLFYVSSYYYLLEATLLTKSKTLLIVGLILLSLRWLMVNVVLMKKESQDV